MILATQELLSLSTENPVGLPGLDAIKDLHIRDIDQVEQFTKLRSLQESFSEFKCIQDPNFLENVSLLWCWLLRKLRTGYYKTVTK